MSFSRALPLPFTTAVKDDPTLHTYGAQGDGTTPEYYLSSVALATSGNVPARPVTTPGHPISAAPSIFVWPVSAAAPNTQTLRGVPTAGTLATEDGYVVGDTVLFLSKAALANPVTVANGGVDGGNVGVLASGPVLSALACQWNGTDWVFAPWGSVNAGSSATGQGFWLVGGNPTGPISGGTLDGSTMTVGGLSPDATTAINSGAGGQVNIGGATAVFNDVADSVQVRTANNGPITIAASGSGNLTESAGATGNASLAAPGGGVSVGAGVAAPAAVPGELLASAATLINLVAPTVEINGVPVVPVQFVYQQGGVADGNVSTTFAAALANCVAVAPNPAVLIVDGSLGQPVVTPGNYTVPANLTLRAKSFYSGATLNIQEGAHFVPSVGADILHVDGLSLNWQNTSSPCMSFSAGSLYQVTLSNNASITADVAATTPFILFAGSFLTVIINGAFIVGSAAAPVIDATAGETFINLGLGSNCYANSLTGVGTIPLKITDVTSTIAYPQTGASGLAVSGGVQRGSGVLTNGALAVTGVTLTANSVISVSVGAPVPGAGSLTVRYDVLQSSRVNSGAAAGSFTITALLAAGTINVLDESTSVRWSIVGT